MLKKKIIKQLLFFSILFLPLISYFTGTVFPFINEGIESKKYLTSNSSIMSDSLREAHKIRLYYAIKRSNLPLLFWGDFDHGPIDLKKLAIKDGKLIKGVENYDDLYLSLIN